MALVRVSAGWLADAGSAMLGLVLIRSFVSGKEDRRLAANSMGWEWSSEMRVVSPILRVVMSPSSDVVLMCALRRVMAFGADRIAWVASRMPKAWASEEARSG